MGNGYEQDHKNCKLHQYQYENFLFLGCFAVWAACEQRAGGSMVTTGLIGVILQWMV